MKQKSTEEKYELCVTCKSQDCRTSFALGVVPHKGRGPTFGTQREAVEALAAILQAYRHEQEETLYRLIHGTKPVDVVHEAYLETCPKCNRMYHYTANEVFIQMPPEERSPSVAVIDL